MLSNTELKQIINHATLPGVDFAELYIQDVRRTSVVREEEKITEFINGCSQGAGLRLLVGDTTYFASTNNVCPESLKVLAKQVSKQVTSRTRNKRRTLHKVTKWKMHVASLPCNVILPETIPAERKAKLVTSMDNVARKVVSDGTLHQVQVGYSDGIKNITIANSSGILTREQRCYTFLTVTVTTGRQSVIQSGHEVLGGTVGWEKFEKDDPFRYARIAARRARQLLDAEPAEAREMPVVISSEAGGTMIHEAIGHCLEADLVQKGISPAYRGKLGQQVASEKLTVVDDGTLPTRNGSYAFDDEGTPAQRTVLVEKGILKSYMYDNFTAGKDHCKSTGNGRRNSFVHKPIPRMSNTFILPGNEKPQKIIASVESGLFVKRLGGGEVNTANGDFVFEVEEGYKIKDGQVSSPVRGALLIGNGPEVLKSISRVGNDLGFGLGTCGKDGQGVPVGDGQPTLLIPRITIGGSGI